MESMGGVLSVIIQYPMTRPGEIDAFNKGFRRYAYLESEGNPPVAVWVFDFPNPDGPIDLSFNARLADPDAVSYYLDAARGIKNAIYFFLLDGEILKAIKPVGLHEEAVRLFHNTIRKQLSLDYSEGEFAARLGGLFTRSTRKLYEMGTEFRFDPP